MSRLKGLRTYVDAEREKEKANRRTFSYEDIMRLKQPTPKKKIYPNDPEKGEYFWTGIFHKREKCHINGEKNGKMQIISKYKANIDYNWWW